VSPLTSTDKSRSDFSADRFTCLNAQVGPHSSASEEPNQAYQRRLMQTQSIKRNLLPIKQLTDDQLGEKEESSSFQKKDQAVSNSSNSESSESASSKKSEDRDIVGHMREN